MTASKQISDARAFVAEYCEEALVLEPADYDEALVGVVEKINFGPVACYDWDKLVEAAMKVVDDDRGVAIEHLDFNVAGSLGQEASPVILHRPPDFGGGDALG